MPVVPTPVPVVPIPTNGINTQKRIVFCGYWLTDEIIQPMVTALKNANITHLLLTFITQPDCTKPLNAFQSMLSAFQNLQPSNQSLLLNNYNDAERIDDQRFWIDMYLKNKDLIGLDTNAEIFLNTCAKS